MNFISTELHKQFTPLFAPDSTDAVKDAQRAKLGGRFDWTSARLGAEPWRATLACNPI